MVQFRAAEIRFQLHKEFCAAEIRFSLHKEFSTVMDLEAMGAILMKIVILSKENWSHMDNFESAESWDVTVTRNVDFQYGKSLM